MVKENSKPILDDVLKRNRKSKQHVKNNDKKAHKKTKIQTQSKTSLAKNKGKVFICGAGPGDPGLITVRCLELLKGSDIVLYDRLVGKEIISLIPDQIEKIYVGRTAGEPTTNQDNTNVLMVKYANQGKNVLRLKGGDPFIFGRGGEEAEYLLKNE